MKECYKDEVFQILHYFNNYLDTKSRVELRKAEVWVSLLQKSVAELEFFSEFYVPDFYRSILWGICKSPPIPLNGSYVTLLERIQRKRRVSTYEDYVKLADLLSELYVQLSES